MLRTILSLCALVVVACVVTIGAVATLSGPPVRPYVDEPSQPVVSNIETIGPAALCHDGQVARSDRADGVTVHWCEDASS